MTQISTTATSLQLMHALQYEPSAQRGTHALSTSAQQTSQSDIDISSEAHTLILKDRLTDSSQMMAMVTVSGDALETITEHLVGIKSSLSEMSTLDEASTEFATLKQELLQKNRICPLLWANCSTRTTLTSL